MAKVTDRTLRPPGGYPKLILWPCPPMETTDVSHRVLKEFFIYGGEQTQVVAASVSRIRTRPPSVTVANVVHSVLGDWRVANISCDDDTDGTFFIKLSSAADVEKFHGHGLWWFQELVMFRHVIRLNESAHLTAKASAENFAP